MSEDLSSPAYAGFRPRDYFPRDEEVDKFGREMLRALDLIGVKPGGEFLLTPPERPP